MSRHLDLMRLHDGELSAEEAAELERSLSQEDRAVLGGLEQLGDVLRASEREELARFAGVADAVMAALEREQEPAKVVPLRPRVEADPELPASRRRKGRSTPVVIAGLALAAAAATALWLSTPPPAPSAPLPVAAPVEPSLPAQATSATPATVAELVEEDADPAATIEAVDFGNRGGSIFMVPAGAESTPVVWLVDDPAGARVEPL